MTLRQQKIVSVLPRVEVLADVGCDHGYVGIRALTLGVADKVRFVDISQPSLDKARGNVCEALKTRASFICRDGLGDLKCDCAVIAGMGGMETIKILSQALFPPEYLVLQPMRNVRDLRIFLSAEYKIITDVKFKDVKYYDLIAAKRTVGGEDLSELEAEFGKTNLLAPSKDFENYLSEQKQQYENISRAHTDDRVERKLALIESAYALIKEIGK